MLNTTWPTQASTDPVTRFATRKTLGGSSTFRFPCADPGAGDLYTGHARFGKLLTGIVPPQLWRESANAIIRCAADRNDADRVRYKMLNVSRNTLCHLSAQPGIG